MAWYKEWFGTEYLDLYSHRNDSEAQGHVDFVLKVLDPAPTAVLDLACGGGRHTLALHQRGIATVGLDRSVPLLALDPSLRTVAGDMRCLPFAAASFDCVLNFFTSFGYFETEPENFGVLDEIRRVLKPRGRFLIDFLNRDRVLEDLKAREVVERDGRKIEIERWYDAATRRINKRIRVGDPKLGRTFLESVRAYDKNEVVAGLVGAGLEVTQVFGNFEGDPYQSNSERLILVGRWWG